MTPGDWVQLVAVVVALLGVAVTFGLTWRGQKHDRQMAEKARTAAEASAERAEKSASLTIDTLDKISDALKQIAANCPDGQAVQPEVKWYLSHLSGDTYQLDNCGTAAAFNLRIEHDPSLWVKDDGLPGQIGPGEATTFMALRTMGTRDSTIVVNWAEADEPDAGIKEWRYPLPSRPS